MTAPVTIPETTRPGSPRPTDTRPPARPAGSPPPSVPRPGNPQPRPRFTYAVLALAALSVAAGLTLITVVSLHINGAQAYSAGWDVALLLSLVALHVTTTRILKTPGRPAPAVRCRDDAASTHSSVWVERPVGSGVPAPPTKTPAALPF